MRVTIDNNTVTALLGCQQNRIPFIQNGDIIEQIDGNRTLIAIVGQILHGFSQTCIIGNVECSISVSEGHRAVFIDDGSRTYRTQGQSAIFQRNTIRIVFVDGRDRHLIRTFQYVHRRTILNGCPAAIEGTDDRTNTLVSVTDLRRNQLCSGNRAVLNQMIGILVGTGMADQTANGTVRCQGRSDYRTVGYGNHRILRHIFLTLCGRRISNQAAGSSTFGRVACDRGGYQVAVFQSHIQKTRHTLNKCAVTRCVNAVNLRILDS